MIQFEEELKKFHPSLEIKDSEKTIYNQDLTDMADIIVGLMQETQTASAPATQATVPIQPVYVPTDTGYIPVQQVVAGQTGFIPQDTGFINTEEMYVPLDETSGNV